MYVKQEIKGKAYRDLIEYISNTCEMISVTEYHDQHSKDTEKELSIILEETKLTKEKLIEYYSKNFLEKMYEKFKNNNRLFNKEYIEKYETYDKLTPDTMKFLIEQRKRIIQDIINRVIYQDRIQKWLKKYQPYVIKSEKSYIESINEEIVPYQTIYYLKMNEELKKELLSKNSFFEWCYPDMIEDISFFRNSRCWLFNVAHEEICEINCETEEEYQKMKSIGIKFLEKQFIPRKQNDFTYAIEEMYNKSQNNL